MAESEAVALRRDETVPGKPFTNLELIDRDVAILQDMLDDLLLFFSESDAGLRVIVPHERVAWLKDGLARRALICDEGRLRAHKDVCVVGFFGERRTELDIGPLEEANAAMVAQFKSYPGILSYSSIELDNGYWANMVLHDDPIDREYWRGGALHAQAARTLSPIHYRNVRIHNARLTTRIEDEPVFKIMRTKYWDYSGETQWAAQRELVADAPPATH